MIHVWRALFLLAFGFGFSQGFSDIESCKEVDQASEVIESLRGKIFKLSGHPSEGAKLVELRQQLDFYNSRRQMSLLRCLNDLSIELHLSNAQKNFWSSYINDTRTPSGASVKMLTRVTERIEILKNWLDHYNKMTHSI